MLADDQRDAAVGVHVISSVLGIVFQNENRSVLPVRAVRNCFDNTAHGEIVIGNGSDRTGKLAALPGSVVVRQAQHGEGRQLLGITLLTITLLTIALLTRSNKLFKFVQKLIDTKLVGILSTKIGEVRIEVAAQFRLRRNVVRGHRYRPGIWTG